MQGFYFFVKFGLALTYILKVDRKKSSSILLRKNIEFVTCFFFWKACTFSSFERFLCWKFRNYSQIYLSLINKYWDSILTLYIAWRALSLVCFLSVFFFYFFSLFFSFYPHFPCQTLTIHEIRGTGEGIIIFIVFQLHLLTIIHLIHRDFYHLFLLDLFAITRSGNYK